MNEVTHMRRTVFECSGFTIRTDGKQTWWTLHECGNTSIAPITDSIDAVFAALADDQTDERAISLDQARDLFRVTLNRLHGMVTTGSKSMPGGDLYLLSDPVRFHCDMMRALISCDYRLLDHDCSHPQATVLPMRQVDA